MWSRRNLAGAEGAYLARRSQQLNTSNNISLQTTPADHALAMPRSNSSLDQHTALP